MPDPKNLLKGHSSGVSGVAFSPDGQTVASASGDKTIKLWEVATGQEKATLKGHSDWVNGVAFSPDGQTVASASDDQTIKLWEVATGQEKATLKGHSDWVNGVAFSPDGQTVASASDDQTIKLWEVTVLIRPDLLIYWTEAWCRFDPETEELTWNELPRNLYRNLVPPFRNVPWFGSVGVLQRLPADDPERNWLLYLKTMEAENWAAAAILRERLTAEQKRRPHASVIWAARSLGAQMAAALAAGFPKIATMRLTSLQTFLAEIGPSCRREVVESLGHALATTGVSAAVSEQFERSLPIELRPWIDHTTVRTGIFRSLPEYAGFDAVRKAESKAREWGPSGASPYAGVRPEALSAVALLAAKSDEDEAKTMLQEVLPILEPSLPELPSQTRTAVLRILAMGRIGREALQTWRKLLGTGFEMAEEVRTAGDLAAELHDRAVCREIFENGLKDFPDDAGWLNFHFGLALRGLGAEEEALANFRAAHENPAGFSKSATISFDTDGKPLEQESGNVIQRLRTNEMGRTTEAAYFGLDGIPILSPDSVAGWRSKFDGNGRETLRSYFGLDGKPTLSAEGIASWSSKFDKQGHKIETTRLGIDGKPVEIDGYATSKSQYDENGIETEVRYFGVDGKPKLRADGIAGWSKKFDSEYNEIETTTLGITGKPIETDGYATVKRQFDEDGNKIEVRYVGGDGKPALSAEGLAGLSSKFDSEGNEIETTTLGISGKPTEIDGYATVKTQFDENGNETEVRYFGANGKPTLSVEGLAGWSSKFDERGNEIETTTIGIDGKPMEIDGLATVKTEFDENGNEMEVRYFGANGKPTLNEEGVARWSSKFDENGNEIEVRCFGANGKPTLSVEGLAGWSSKFDERGNEIEVRYFGASGKPALNIDGFATIKSLFDENGNEIEYAGFSVDGTPAIGKNGFHRRTGVTNAAGDEIESSRFGVLGERVVSTYGFHREQIRYDGARRKVEQAWFGVRDEPVVNNHPEFGAARCVWRYDADGSLLETLRYGVDGQPIKSSRRLGSRRDHP